MKNMVFDIAQVEAELSRQNCGIALFSDQKDVIETIRILKPYYSGIDLIRVGGDGEGGYLVPDDLEGIKYCFSPGVSDVANFELYLAEKHNIKSFMIDASVENAPVLHPLFDFERKFLSTKHNDNCVYLEGWVEQKIGLSSDDDLILQMDIEYGEYDTIISTPSYVFDKFRVMVIEFHFLNLMIYECYLPILQSILRKITKNHTVVHLHPNNYKQDTKFYGLSIPFYLEVTLLRNDRFTQSTPCNTFPTL
jgi:hypothetical protein